MRRALLSCLAALAALALAPAGAAAQFGFSELEVAFVDSEGVVDMRAGAHPFAMSAILNLNADAEGNPEGAIKDLVVDLPEGLAVNPTAAPKCSAVDFITLDDVQPQCPDASAVGVIGARELGGDPIVERATVYNLQPPPGAAAKLGFHILGVSVVLEGGVRPESPSNAFAMLGNVPQAAQFAGSELTLWGVPADSRHDSERGKCLLGEESCPVDVEPRAFLTLPRSCEGPLESTFKARSWQDPGTWVTEATETDDGLLPPSPLGPVDCAALGFSPEIAATPTSTRAATPTGLSFELDVTDPGFTEPDQRADSEIKQAVVTLPRGVTVNPSVAAGLTACSPARYEAETPGSEPGQGCPQAAKVGQVAVQTPLLDKTLRGEVFVAQPFENPFGSLIALYMVIRDRELGVLVKLAGKVEADEQTGRLTTTFGRPGEEVPQVPFSRFSFEFRPGARAPLITPPTCGTHTTRAVFTPWANPENPFATTATFQVTEGVGGAPCPTGGSLPFDPGFAAGSLNNAAGRHTPFAMRMTRQDGHQDIVRFDATLPEGLVGKLAGIAKCSDAQIAQAKASSGEAELADPSCPQGSKIGTTLAGAGAGSALTYVPGSLYLAGPFNGAPLSVVAVTPAVAGPFDVGTVVIREALDLDPVTAQVSVDGEASDPIPHALEGIPLALRDLRVNVDRPGFILNPTSCDPARIEAQIFGGGSFLSPAGPSAASEAARYQAAGCAALGFAPRLGLRLFGGVRRGTFPALRLAYVPRTEQQANLRRLSLTLPSSAFIEQGHFRTICTRVQFAADKCPQAAIYGRAVAYSPLLDEPLRGPVYLRSSDNPLPDAVLDLRGIVDVEVGVRIDSVKGRLRATTINAPDVPVSRVVVQMQGGQKGLFVNSRHLCLRPARNRANIGLAAHNNRTARQRPVVRSVVCQRRARKALARRAARRARAAARSLRQR